LQRIIKKAAGLVSGGFFAIWAGALRDTALPVQPC
jgi:hypothetical protein